MLPHAAHIGVVISGVGSAACVDDFLAMSSPQTGMSMDRPAKRESGTPIIVHHSETFTARSVSGHGMVYARTITPVGYHYL